MNSDCGVDKTPISCSMLAFTADDTVKKSCLDSLNDEKNNIAVVLNEKSNLSVPISKLHEVSTPSFSRYPGND